MMNWTKTVDIYSFIVIFTTTSTNSFVLLINRVIDEGEINLRSSIMDSTKMRIDPKVIYVSVAFVLTSLFISSLVVLLEILLFGVLQVILIEGVVSLCIYLFDLKSVLVGLTVRLAPRKISRSLMSRSKQELIPPEDYDSIDKKLDQMYSKSRLSNFQLGRFLINVSLIGYSMYSDIWQIWFFLPLFIHILVMCEVWKVSKGLNPFYR